MKQYLFLLLFLSTLTGVSIITSCEPDNTLASDSTDIRNEYIGVWRFTEKSSFKSTETQSYIVTIRKDATNGSQVILDNFGNPGNSEWNVTGIVTANQIIVPSQVMGTDWTSQGSGKRTAKGKMEWTYSITAGGEINYYTAEATKQ